MGKSLIKGGIMEEKKSLLEHLKLCSEQNICDDETKCIVDRKDLQELLLDYMTILQKIEKMQRTINVYRSYKDCDEEFEL
jgi:flagellar biosynthesis/type III secretory pathway chaperone